MWYKCLNVLNTSLMSGMKMKIDQIITPAFSKNKSKIYRNGIVKEKNINTSRIKQICHKENSYCKEKCIGLNSRDEWVFWPVPCAIPSVVFVFSRCTAAAGVLYIRNIYFIIMQTIIFAEYNWCWPPHVVSSQCKYSTVYYRELLFWLNTLMLVTVD